MILDFERDIHEMESKIEELKQMGIRKNIDVSSEIRKMEDKLEKVRNQIYNNLSTWQRVQIARHTDRPFTLDYIRMIMTDFVEIHGDRLFADDLALIAGLAKLEDHTVLVMGHQKGRNTNENVMRNFGCAHPEGYRKALRLMKLAEKFSIPIIILIDTPGAYPGVGAEERGQAQAIAENLKEMARIKTSIIATVIGEGGSGGALGVGVADRVCILQHAYYSVISPEGCASILWRNSVKAPEAAEALKITSEHLLKFGIVDKIIQEPLGGAHNDPVIVAENLKKILVGYIDELAKIPKDKLIDERYEKFRQIGLIIEEQKPSD